MGRNFSRSGQVFRLDGEICHRCAVGYLWRAASGRAMNYTASEIMTVAASRALTNDDICFVGIGLPSAACNLARLTYAPRITLVYESGTVATKPNILLLSIGDGELCDTAMTTV